MIPGSNLLSQALSMIASQTVRLYTYNGRATNVAGKNETVYLPAIVSTVGSVQAVPANRYEQLGLDRKASHVTWFVPANVRGVNRGRNGDQFGYNGQRYNIISETPWLAQDGWVEIVGINIGPDPDA